MTDVYRISTAPHADSAIDAVRAEVEEIAARHLAGDSER